MSFPCVEECMIDSLLQDTPLEKEYGIRNSIGRKKVCRFLMKGICRMIVLLLIFFTGLLVVDPIYAVLNCICFLLCYVGLLLKCNNEALIIKEDLVNESV
jgi:hypothetical protein